MIATETEFCFNQGDKVRFFIDDAQNSVVLMEPSFFNVISLNLPKDPASLTGLLTKQRFTFSQFCEELGFSESDGNVVFSELRINNFIKQVFG